MSYKIVCGPRKKLVGEYECPKCGAKIGQLCKTEQGQALSDFHKERLELV